MESGCQSAWNERIQPRAHLFVFDGEVVVVGDLITRVDIHLGVYNNLLLSANGNDLRRTIRIARMIDKTSRLVINKGLESA